MKTRMQRKAQRGFTLVELLLVLVILALIGTVVLPSIIGQAEGAKAKAAAAQISRLSMSVENFYLDTGNTPDGLDELVNSQDIRESLAGINSIINMDDTQKLTTTLRGTLSDASSLLRNADSTLDTLKVDLKPVVDRVIGVLDEAEEAIAAAADQLEGESAESYQLGTTLKEVKGAARALREFLDYLERNPEAVLRGKQQ